MTARSRRSLSAPAALAAAALGLLASPASALSVAATRLGEPENRTEERRPYWHRLRNLKDVQYLGSIKVGGQVVTGLFDTGSFELLVFGEDCVSCGQAVAYHRSISTSYAAGRGSESHSFGSGTCYSNDGYERLEIGPLAADHAPFWEVVRAEMPVLEAATFQSIIGIGPPGEPAASAKFVLEKIRKQEEQYRRDSGVVPPELLEQEREFEEKVRTDSSKLSLVESLGVSRFSHCLGRTAGSPGWLVFDDLDPRTRPESFASLQVAGKLTWSVQVTGMFLRNNFDNTRIPLGCQPSCGAIVDTGTSLFSLPTHVYKKIFESIKSMDGDCGDLRMFPDLVVQVNGQDLPFPAESYIGKVDGSVPDPMKDLVHANQDVAFGSIPGGGAAPLFRLEAASDEVSVNTTTDDRQKCQLLLMDMGEEITQLGPLAILGMPFFREYYTTFDIGAPRVDNACCCNATFVDNLLTIAETPENAITIMARCEEEPRKRWCLNIGADTKEFMTCRAYPHAINLPPAWTRHSVLKCLGHRIDDDGGLRTCFQKSAAAMAKSFYANLTAGLLRAPISAKYRVMNTCVRSVGSFCWSRWPYVKTYAAKLDRLQRTFFTSLMQVKRKRLVSAMGGYNNDGAPV
ncbi:unnamed protein product [Prorocentrum cordatum]|uniref:Peptidase A1 domain-containing protein n=1 Tax=Prorocentrum cordatum TaxID=2364126 RepID=A0ABN9XMI6_9DINO|nr:unnamed protein product [Polarella glacialis]